VVEGLDDHVLDLAAVGEGVLALTPTSVAYIPDSELGRPQVSCDTTLSSGTENARVCSVGSDRALIVGNGVATLVAVDGKDLVELAQLEAAECPDACWAGHAAEDGTVTVHSVRDGALVESVYDEAGSSFGRAYPLTSGFTDVDAVHSLSHADPDGNGSVIGLAVLSSFESWLVQQGGHSRGLHDTPIQRLMDLCYSAGGFYVETVEDTLAGIYSSLYFGTDTQRIGQTSGGGGKVWSVAFGFGILTVIRRSGGRSIVENYDFCRTA
jgi:hypothetical protein